MGMVIARYSKPRVFVLAAALVAVGVGMFWAAQPPKGVSYEAYLSMPGQTPIDGIVALGTFFAPVLIFMALVIGCRLLPLLVRAILVSDGLLLFFPIYADGFLFKDYSIPLQNVDRVSIGRMPFPLWPLTGIVMHLAGGRRKGIPTYLLGESRPEILSQLREALAERSSQSKENAAPTAVSKLSKLIARRHRRRR